MGVGTKFAWSVSAWPEALRERLKSDGLVHIRSGYLNNLLTPAVPTTEPRTTTPTLSFSPPTATVMYIDSLFCVTMYSQQSKKENQKRISLNKVSSMVTS